MLQMENKLAAPLLQTFLKKHIICLYSSKFSKGYGKNGDLVKVSVCTARTEINHITFFFALYQILKSGVLSGLFGSSKQRGSKNMELRKQNYEIIPIIVDVPSNLRTINFFLVKAKESLALIDAGLDHEACWNALLETLQKNGLALHDLTEIILTHNHIDHVGLVNRIIADHPIQVYAHKNAIPRLKRDRQFLEMRVEFFSKLYEEMGCHEAGRKQVDYLKESIVKNRKLAIQAEIIPVESSHLDFQIIEVPGHAPDQIALYDPKHRWMISGDLLIQHISSNALVEPDSFGRRMPTLLQHKHSLEKVSDLPLDLVFPGHGVFIQDPKDLINKRLKGIEKKAEKIMNLILNGVTTASGLAQAYYGNKYSEQFSLVMSEIIGHLDYLELNGKIRKKMEKGVWHYSINKE